MRDEEFKPLDIKATIPKEAAKAEADRNDIRARYDIMQVYIDDAENVTALKAALSEE